MVSFVENATRHKTSGSKLINDNHSGITEAMALEEEFIEPPLGDSTSIYTLIDELLERIGDFFRTKNIPFKISMDQQQLLTRNIFSAISDQVDFLKYEFPPIR